jgi:LysM repeat protein
MKKGYKAEWEAKKILFKKYPKDSVFKVAIGGAVDFFILGKNAKVEKIVEVKKTNKKQWYPTEHDKKQYQTLVKIQKKFKIPVEYWIKIRGKWKIFDLKEVKKFFS